MSTAEKPGVVTEEHLIKRSTGEKPSPAAEEHLIKRSTDEKPSPAEEHLIKRSTGEKPSPAVVTSAVNSGADDSSTSLESQGSVDVMTKSVIVSSCEEIVSSNDLNKTSDAIREEFCEFETRVESYYEDTDIALTLGQIKAFRQSIKKIDELIENTSMEDFSAVDDEEDLETFKRKVEDELTAMEDNVEIVCSKDVNKRFDPIKADLSQFDTIIQSLNDINIEWTLAQIRAFRKSIKKIDELSKTFEKVSEEDLSALGDEEEDLEKFRKKIEDELTVIEDKVLFLEGSAKNA